MTMMIQKFGAFTSARVRSWELGLVFRDGELEDVLGPGRHIGRYGRELGLVSLAEAWFSPPRLDVLVKSPLLAEHLMVVDLADHDRPVERDDG